MMNDTKSLEERLEAHPELKEHILALLDVAESGLRRADDVEEELIEKVKGLGQQVMQDWAERGEQAADQSFRESGEKVVSNGKKNSTGTRALGKSP
ncbi:hypothetical protein IH781_03450 [Patescibacteria group bacterium]|nr:hypothetical protein [Patescibacteria group bacterium]